jgi:iron complex outermembrane receptor protein
VSSYHTEDLFVSYGFNSRVGKTNLMAGVLNVGNAPPARIYNGFIAQTDAYNYDVMGRFFYVRLAQTY